MKFVAIACRRVVRPVNVFSVRMCVSSYPMAIVVICGFVWKIH